MPLLPIVNRKDLTQYYDFILTAKGSAAYERLCAKGIS